MDSLRKKTPHTSNFPEYEGSSVSLGTTQISVPPHHNRAKSSSKKRFFWIGGIVTVLGSTLMGLVFFGQVAFTHSVHFENRELSFFDTVKLVGKGWFQKATPLEGESDGRVNLLLLGRAGEHYPGKNLTDTVMIVSLDMQQKRVGILSLPRDLFVPIVGTYTSTKINSLYQIGLNEGVGTKLLRESITEITGLPIHYTTSIDFDGFEKMIDTLGGIELDVPQRLHDQRYPGKNYSYETFTIEPGFQKLDGKTALKYARERHADPEGDFGRAKRQQAVLQAMRERAFSLPTFLNPFTLISFLQSLGESLTTDVPPEAIERLAQLGGKFDTQNVHAAVVDAWKKESLLRVDHLDTPSGRAFILVPRSGDWQEVQELAVNIFEKNQGTLLWDRMLKEHPSVTIFTAPSRRKVAEDLRENLLADFPLQEIIIEALPQLERMLETAMIEDGQDLQKPYTLDALIKRYGLMKIDQLPFSLPEKKDSDYSILFTRTSFDQTSTETPTDIPQYDFQEPLSPQKTP